MAEFLLTVAGIGALVLIVPLMVWGGTGDWRHAMHALKSYMKIMGAFALIGGGIGIPMAIAEHGADIFSLLR